MCTYNMCTDQMYTDQTDAACDMQLGQHALAGHVHSGGEVDSFLRTIFAAYRCRHNAAKA